MADLSWLGDPLPIADSPPDPPRLPPTPPNPLRAGTLINVDDTKMVRWVTLTNLDRIEAKLDQLLERLTALEKYHEDMYDGQ